MQLLQHNMNIIITTRKQHPVSDEALYALAQQSTVDRCWHLKNGRPATPPVEKKQSRLLALYSKDEIPTLSRKVYFSVLSDVAAKDKSPASLLLRNIFSMRHQEFCWLTAANGLAALLQQKPRVQDSGSCLFPFTESDSA